MFRKRTVRDLEAREQRVLVRVDFNVPLRDGEIQDDRRIRAARPTLMHLRKQGARVVCMSHLGRPKGKVVEGLRLGPVARRLGELLETEVRMAPAVVGPEVEALVEGTPPGGVVLLENLRFHPGETANDPEFVRALAALGELYVNDAFGTCHRAHASVVGVPRVLGAGYTGFLVERELTYFGRALAAAERPFYTVLGGAKVKDKLPVVKNLLGKVDGIFLGGGMAYTFLRAQGAEVGDSLVDEEFLAEAREVLAAAARRGVLFVLPQDHVVAERAAADAKPEVAARIPAGKVALDIGPETAALYARRIRQARTVVWNGPMGVFEWEAFRKGTTAVAAALAACAGTTIVGGGDSAAALELLGLADRVSHVSTGGGASLELLAGRELPGVAALTDA